jgi:hypothetical protein
MDLPAKRTYPRALPHRSLDDIVEESEHQRRTLEAELAAQAERLRCVTTRFVVALATTIVLATATVVVALKWPAFLGVSTDVAIPVSDVGSVQPPKRSAPTLKANPPAPNSDASAKPAPEPAPAPPAQADRDASAAASSEVFLEVLGGLSAAHLYESYLTIGLLADGVESRAYPVADAKVTLRIITDYLTLVETKLSKLETLGLEPDDQDALKRLKTVSRLLRLQSQTLLAYWASGQKGHGEQYQQTRKASWTALSKVLGLDAK